ncbi:uncharacterized protein LOC144474703 isoform X2 [Augochlora pura]
MNQLFILFSFSTIYLIANVILCDRCNRINLQPLPYYKLIKSNVRSNHLLLSRTVVRNVNECRQFALAKKALAFNYGLESNHNEWIWNTGNKRRKGTNFTLTCVPKTGIFVISNNYLNYSQAEISCQKINSTLAHIISEERTEGLAKYISENTPTFVGLSSRDHEKIWKNQFDEPLSCFKYRAWGKGEPSHTRGCVTIIKPSESEHGPFWKVVPCNSLLHFICEISPMYQSLHN